MGGDPGAVRHHGRGVLTRVPQDELGAPLVEHPCHPGQHGLRRHPPEELAVGQARRFRRRGHREALPDGRHIGLGGLAACREAVPGPGHQVAEGGRPGHQGLVALALGGPEEGTERVEVTRPAE